jgi:hypothetical protein
MENLNCEYCLEIFDDDEQLKKHNKTNKTCFKYKDVLFTCIKCNFKTFGIKNIDKHVKKCEGFLTKEDHEKLKNNELLLNNKNLELEIIKKLDVIVSNTTPKPMLFNHSFIKPEIKVEKKSSPPIKQLKEVESIQFYNKDENILYDDNFSISNSSSSPYILKSKKSTYKKISSIELINERPKDIIDKIKENFDEKQKCFDEVILKSEQIFKECFEIIKTTHAGFPKQMDIIKKTRLNLIDCMSYTQYYNLIQRHLKILEHIFKQKKEYSEKKIISIISKSMNTLDMRIVYYLNYINISIDTFEIQKLKNSLITFNDTIPNYVKFDSEVFFKKFYNYSSALFTIKDSIETYISNIYGLHNIIYIKLKQSIDNDPYGFYILEEITIKDKKNIIEKRYWKMDCRLEELSNSFIFNVRPYLIQLFRKIYYDVFNDNQYRKNYISTNSITEYDCQQLLKNIYTLSNPKEFCFLFRNIIKDKCTYQPTELDRFNLYGDDIVQKKRLSNNKESVDVIEDVIKLIFDNISSEDAVDFYRSG